VSNIVIDAPRVRNGQPVKAEIVTRYVDDGRGLPLVVILSKWSPGPCRYRAKDVYRCEEIPTPDGRGFMFHRSAEAVERDPDHVERYGVFIAYTGETSNLCECKGHASRGYCKHVDALKGLLAAGHIDRVEADRPVEALAGPAPF
jgi:hypothetical protein